MLQKKLSQVVSPPHRVQDVTLDTRWLFLTTQERPTEVDGTVIFVALVLEVDQSVGFALYAAMTFASLANPNQKPTALRRLNQLLLMSKLFHLVGRQEAQRNFTRRLLLLRSRSV